MLREEEYNNGNLIDTGSSNYYPKINVIRISILGILIALILYIISLNNYLLFHSLAESFSIIISCGIFMFIWNSRRHIDNNFFIIIGIAYLFIAFLDLIHTFTYRGVQIIPEHTTNLPTQLWIAARYLQSLTLLAAPFFIGKKIRTFIVMYAYALITVIIITSIFFWKIFPQCYIEGFGLTSFKKVSEYIISLVLLSAVFALGKKRSNFDRYVFHLIEASIIITIISELCFTLYTSAYGLFNLIGHLLKIVAFYLIYRAIIVVGLYNPFNFLFGRLKQKEEALRLTRFSVDRADDLMIWINPGGYITDVNDTTVKKLNYLKDEIVGFLFSKIDRNFDLVKFTEAKNKTLTEEHSFIAKNSNKIPVEVEFNFLEYEGNNYYCAFARDITERKKAEEALKESEARFRNMADNAPVMIWMSDENKSRTYCNRRWLEFTGHTLEQEKGIDWMQPMHPEDKEKYRKEYDKAFAERKEFNIEYRLRRYDGQYRWILNTGIPRFTSDGNFIGYIGSAYDITEKRQAREEMRLSLTEKVTLLKEIHHRIKNNLQVISSLLNIQSSYIKDDETREMFTESRNRIKSMALIHEKLYLSKDLSHINFSEYIHELVSSLLITFKINSNKIALDIRVEDIKLDVDLALNIGLIINELVSNTFKYAFPGGVSRNGGKCELQIKLNSSGCEKTELIIKDNGIGLPSNVDIKHTNTFGLQIVSALVEQYNGIIESNNESGTEYIITFNQ
ncbi:MAG: MASE3 domain-containing protein [Ignavibacteriaceae bacterium]